MRVRLFVLCVSVLAFSICASAGNVYQTGFESPAYTTGTLNGQNGWFNSTIPVVETAVVHSGSQAVGFDASKDPGGQNAVVTPLSFTASPANPVVTVQVDAYFTQPASGNTFWDVAAVVSSTGFIDQLEVDNSGNAVLGLASTGVGSVPVLANAWNTFDLMLDYNTQTSSAYVNGTFIGSGAFANPSTDLTFLGFGVNGSFGQGTGQMYVDDIVVSTPEPSTLVLLSLGAAFGYFRRRSVK